MKHGDTQLFLDSIPLSCHGNPLIPLHTCRPGQTEPIRGADTSGGTKQQNNFGWRCERHGSGAQTRVWRPPLSRCREKGGRSGGVMRWSVQPRWGKLNNGLMWWIQPSLYCSGDTPHRSSCTLMRLLLLRDLVSFPGVWCFISVRVGHGLIFGTLGVMRSGKIKIWTCTQTSLWDSCMQSAAPRSMIWITNHLISKDTWIQWKSPFYSRKLIF